MQEPRSPCWVVIRMSDHTRSVQIPSGSSLHDPYYKELQHFIECIRNGSDPLVSIEDACYAVAIAQAAGQSAQTGQPVMIGGNVS